MNHYNDYDSDSDSLYEDSYSNASSSHSSLRNSTSQSFRSDYKFIFLFKSRNTFFYWIWSDLTGDKKVLVQN